MKSGTISHNLSVVFVDQVTHVIRCDSQIVFVTPADRVYLEAGLLEMGPNMVIFASNRTN